MTADRDLTIPVFLMVGGAVSAAVAVVMATTSVLAGIFVGWAVVLLWASVVSALYYK